MAHITAGLAHGSENFQAQAGARKWDSLASPILDDWEDRVRSLLKRIDFKLKKNLRACAAYKLHLQWLLEMDTEGVDVATVVESAMLRVQATQDTLLAILDLQRRAILDDYTQQLYNSLMTLSIQHAQLCATWFGGFGDERMFTKMVMAVVTRAVHAKSVWVDREFDSRTDHVMALTTAQCQRLQDLLPAQDSGNEAPDIGQQREAEVAVQG